MVSPGKSYLFLQNYKIFGNPSWKFDLFLWYFFLLENLMCSNEILDKISWKIWSVLIIPFPPGKWYVFLRNCEKVLREILMCSRIFCLSWKIYMCYVFWFSWKVWCVLIKELCLLLENLRCSYYIQVSCKIWRVLEISLKKSLLEKKNRYFSKIARRLLL